MKLNSRPTGYGAMILKVDKLVKMYLSMLRTSSNQDNWELRF